MKKSILFALPALLFLACKEQPPMEEPPTQIAYPPLAMCTTRGPVVDALAWEN